MILTGGTPRVAAVILAAGASGRMGSPKALLRTEGHSFVRTIIDRFREAGIDGTFVVVGAHAKEIRTEIEGMDVGLIDNPSWPEGQLSSIQRGIGCVERDGFDAAMIAPVDHPAVLSSTIAALLSGYRTHPHAIVLPVCGSRRGHPALFDRSVFRELLQASPAVGAREVIRRDPSRILEVHTNDEGVITDIDTPEEFARYLQSRS
jgi:molybdenum cofactor cytidylyltransferase